MRRGSNLRTVILFECLIFEIGVKPLKVYKQIPFVTLVCRNGKYFGNCISSRYVVDSTGFEDRNYTNVNAHELAHQWFGI
jgi:aminopeptidase N